MTALWWARLRAHPIHAVVLGGCAAFVSMLVWDAVAIFLSSVAEVVDPAASGLLQNPGLTPGVALAALLLTAPVLALLHQLVRLGACKREATLSTYRMLGGSVAQVRVVAALEIAVPAAFGALLGWPLLQLLRRVLVEASHGVEGGYELVVVPAVAWSALGVVGLTIAVSALVGVVFATIGTWGSSSEFNGVRRTRRGAPRPWGWLLLALAVALFALSTTSPGPAQSLMVVVLAVAGMLQVGPWLAHRVGRSVARRTSDPALFLAARRLEVDPRPVGRAASVIGVVGMVMGAEGELVDTLLTGDAHYGLYYWAPVGMVGVAVIVALFVTLASIVVHSVESLARHAPAIATLDAAGASPRIQTMSRRYEVLLVSVPLGLMGNVLVLVSLSPIAPLSVTAGLGTIAAMGIITTALSLLAVRFTAPWARRATGPENLRTE